MEDLGCAVVWQGIVAMREWKIKDAQWKVCDWTISTARAWHSVTKRYKQFHIKL